ncbi:hypothetical protein BGZ60DRAFT_542774 [Tricladium varicosporioides]|nr:hypothetical protein BGZ60DRAFT_542774 [Hymenoscyphus varicosporioides]
MYYVTLHVLLILHCCSTSIAPSTRKSCTYEVINQYPSVMGALKSLGEKLIEVETRLEAKKDVKKRAAGKEQSKLKSLWADFKVGPLCITITGPSNENRRSKSSSPPRERQRVSPDRKRERSLQALKEVLKTKRKSSGQSKSTPPRKERRKGSSEHERSTEGVHIVRRSSKRGRQTRRDKPSTGKHDDVSSVPPIDPKWKNEEKDWKEQEEDQKGVEVSGASKASPTDEQQQYTKAQDERWDNLAPKPIPKDKKAAARMKEAQELLDKLERKGFKGKTYYDNQQVRVKGQFEAGKAMWRQREQQIREKQCQRAERFREKEGMREAERKRVQVEARGKEQQREATERKKREEAIQVEEGRKGKRLEDERKAEEKRQLKVKRQVEEQAQRTQEIKADEQRRKAQKNEEARRKLADEHAQKVRKATELQAAPQKAQDDAELTRKLNQSEQKRQQQAVISPSKQSTETPLSLPNPQAAILPGKPTALLFNFKPQTVIPPSKQPTGLPFLLIPTTGARTDPGTQENDEDDDALIGNQARTYLEGMALKGQKSPHPATATVTKGRTQDKTQGQTYGGTMMNEEDASALIGNQARTYIEGMIEKGWVLCKELT